MTEEKLRKIITAVAVAATTLLVFLVGVIIYQIVAINVYDDRIEKTKKEIAYWEDKNLSDEQDLDHYLSDEYLQWEAFKLGFIKDQGNK